MFNEAKGEAAYIASLLFGILVEARTRSNRVVSAI
jgi:hypothetical protein